MTYVVNHHQRTPCPVREVRLGWKIVVALILKLLKLQKLLKSFCTQFICMPNSSLLSFHRFNKNVILNTELLLCLVWSYMLLRKRL